MDNCVGVWAQDESIDIVDMIPYGRSAPVLSATKKTSTSASAVNKKLKPASVAIGGGGDESDVSLSDDEDDDAFNRAVRKQLAPKQARKKDGGVAVPVESTNVFLTGMQQLRKEQQAKEATQASRVAAATAALPQRATSAIGRVQQPSVILSSSTSTSAPHQKNSNSILRATSRPVPPNTSRGTHPPTGGLKIINGVLIDSNRLMANSQLASSSSSSAPRGSGGGVGSTEGVMQTLSQGGKVDPRTVEQIIYGHGSVLAAPDRTSALQAQKTAQAAAATAAAEEREERKRAEKRKIEELLGKKSSHAAEGETQWFESFEQRAEKLADREAKQQKAASIVSTFVKQCYHCRECNLTHESQVAFALCTKNGHAVSSVRGIKWFFECGNCRRRDHTITVATSAPKGSGSSSGSGSQRSNSAPSGSGYGNENHNNSSSSSSSSSDNGGDAQVGFAGKQHPTRRCECGAFNWRSSGRSGSFATDSKEHTLVLSATDWTSRQDLHKIAALRNSAL